MHLFDIEEEINEDTFSRGMMYMAEEQVTKISEPYRHHFVVEVAGSLSVDVVLDDSLEVVRTFCDCLENDGYCEHTAAALIALGEEKEDDEPVPDPEGPDIETALASFDQVDLRNLLRSAASDDPEIRSRIFALFHQNKEPLVSAQKQVQAYIDAEMQDGSIAAADVPTALEGAHQVLEKVEEHAAEGRLEEAVQRSLVVLGTVVDALDSFDETAGEPAVVINNSLELLKQAAAAASSALPEDAKQRIHDAVTTEAEEPRYEGRNKWRNALLETRIYVRVEQE
ncbi:SWIM zinc finger family protein [Salibacterium halotolerans]|uniref:SWIM zinc finger n=1 Tax=Salibacterium halotolerans TaxID=1884432 RepID=A0A1I5S1T6_9BACI|nr:SWIM zinc finger family protein [Salibacterium halotolerans]SFP64659.1 SWIM zinc finger [Salibacterium halotolerans]